MSWSFSCQAAFTPEELKVIRGLSKRSPLVFGVLGAIDGSRTEMSRPSVQIRAIRQDRERSRVERTAAGASTLTHRQLPLTSFFLSPITRSHPRLHLRSVTRRRCSDALVSYWFSTGRSVQHPGGVSHSTSATIVTASSRWNKGNCLQEKKKLNGQTKVKKSK